MQTRSTFGDVLAAASSGTTSVGTVVDGEVVVVVVVVIGADVDVDIVVGVTVEISSTPDALIVVAAIM